MSVPDQVRRSNDSLLQAVRQGDGPAFWQLAECYRPYLKTVATRVLGGALPSDGSDVVQDGLVVALRCIGQFKGEQAAIFLGWLAAIVRNHAIRVRKDENRVQPLPAGPGEIQLATGSTGPDARAERREQAARLLAAIEELPEEHRRVIELRNFQELPYEQVALRMGRSYDAVKQLWSRAVKRLRQKLGGDT
jgi:RNA polymerase sigma-70 factor (ECF subfamily)